VLLLVTVGTFLPSLRNDFVNYDDPEYVTNNPMVENGITPQALRWAFLCSEAANWHPLTWLSHMMDCQLFALKPWGHHLTSLLLHTATTLLLFTLLDQMTGALWRSFFAAALFGLHPLRVQSVVWVAERKDVLSALFWMLTLWAYARFVAARRKPPLQSRGFYLLAMAFFLLGLMSKPMLVTLPFVLLLLDFWPLARLQEKPAVLLKEKLPFFLAAIALSVVTFLVQRSSEVTITVARLGLTLRFENALVSYCRYLGKLLCPIRLSAFYPFVPRWPAWTVLGAALVLTSFSLCVMALRRRHPYLLVGWLWFLGTLVPVIGLVQVGAQSMADRYSYLPSVGFFILFVWGIYAVATRVRLGLPALAVAGLLAIGACITLTARQIGYWKDSGTLFRHALAVTDSNWVAWINLGQYSLARGRLDDAIDQLEQAVKVAPSSAEAHVLLGTALYMNGVHDKGMGQLEQGMALDSRNVLAHFNLAAILEEQGRWDEAISQLQEVLRLRPNYAQAYVGLGYALQQKGKTAEAVIQYQKALVLKPKEAKAHQGLGEALEASGHLDEAIRHFRLALLYKPDDPEIHMALALALGKQGLRDEALAHLNQALKLRPNYPEATAALRALTGQATP
jgi:tetratricopeptide (TPR) repeat protein